MKKYINLKTALMFFFFMYTLFLISKCQQGQQAKQKPIYQTSKSVQL